MAAQSKTLIKEISLWKKRWVDSRKALSGLSKTLAKDAKKAYSDLLK